MWCYMVKGEKPGLRPLGGGHPVKSLQNWVDDCVTVR